MAKNFPKTHASTHAAGGIDPIEGAGPTPSSANTKYVLSRADFPAPVGGLITLEPGRDYQVIGPVDMGDNSLVIAGASCRGFAPQTGALYWSAPAPLGFGVQLGDRGWLEALTLTFTDSMLGVVTDGTAWKRMQLCDVLGGTDWLPGLAVYPGTDGLQCFDCFFRGAQVNVGIGGGVQLLNASFDLVGGPSTAYAVRCVPGVVAAAVMLESMQVRFDDAAQTAISLVGTSFAAGFEGLISGLQCDGPGEPLGSHAVPVGWKLRGNGQLFAGTYTQRVVVGPDTVTLGPTDEVVECDPTLGAITLNIPQTYTGHKLSISDVAGAASSNPIVCAGAGGAQVDAAASASITTDFGFFELMACQDFPGAIDWWITGG